MQSFDIESRISVIEAALKRASTDIERIDTDIKISLTKAQESREQTFKKIDEMQISLIKMEMNLLTNFHDIKTQISSEFNANLKEMDKRLNDKISDVDSNLRDKFSRRVSNFENVEKVVLRWALGIICTALILFWVANSLK